MICVAAVPRSAGDDLCVCDSFGHCVFECVDCAAHGGLLSRYSGRSSSNGCERLNWCCFEDCNAVQ